MNKQELLDLAARVEALQGPDREVDALVWREFYQRTPFEEPAEDPLYTTSLDAALTLVPEGEASQVINDAIAALGQQGWHGRWRDALPRFVTAAALRAHAETLP